MRRHRAIIACLTLTSLAVLAPGAAPDQGWSLPLQQPTDRPESSYRLTYDFAGKNAPSFDATRWGLEHKAVFFYEHQAGLYPRFYNGKAENGGVPQRVDLATHLARLRNDVAAKIPDPNWDGYAVLDFESWSPLLSMNRPEYVEESKRLVALDRPGITGQDLDRRARATFDAAARTFLQKTLETCREMRPKAKWGFYCFPQPYHKGTEESLAWLWKSVDALYPGFYIGNYSVTEGQPKDRQVLASVTIGQMRDHLALARKLACLGPERKTVAILLSPRYFEANKTYAWQVLNEADMEITVRLPWLCGADGAIFWDEVRDEADAALLRRYFDDKLGPALERLRGEVRARAKEQPAPGR